MLVCRLSWNDCRLAAAVVTHFVIDLVAGRIDIRCAAYPFCID
jgi:hypothetical protein